MRLVVIGAGDVGKALGRSFLAAGHDVTFGVRDVRSESSIAAASELPKAEIKPVPDAIDAADIIVLAVPYGAAIETAASLGDLAGRTIIDCTNPVGPGLTHGLSSERSGSEAVQEAAPTANVVKAFSIYGFEVLGEPQFAESKPVMMLAGDDGSAVEAVSELAREIGFEPLCVGGLESALQLEHMTLLWVRMVRANRHGTGLAWGLLRRD